MITTTKLKAVRVAWFVIASFRSFVAFTASAFVVASSTFAFGGFAADLTLTTLVATFVAFASGTTKPSFGFSWR
jgi:hypothetical protein